jgi:hypothetical protein
MAPVRAVWGYSPPYLHAQVRPLSPVRTPSQCSSQSNAVSEDKGREAEGGVLDCVRPIELSDFRKYCNVHHARTPTSVLTLFHCCHSIFSVTIRFLQEILLLLSHLREGLSPPFIPPFSSISHLLFLVHSQHLLSLLQPLPPSLPSNVSCGYRHDDEER